MTTPGTRADIVSGCTTYLKAQPDVLATVSVFQIDGQAVPGVFGYNNWVPLEGTGATCVVLDNEGGWAAPNFHNTLRFPRLSVNIWADPIRDPQNNVIDPGEVMLRVENTYDAIDRHLHRVAGEAQMWGPVRTLASVRLTEPLIYRVPDGDGLVRLMANYAVTQG